MVYKKECKQSQKHAKKQASCYTEVNKCREKEYSKKKKDDSEYLKKLFQGSQIAHERFENEVSDAIELAYKALCELKEAIKAHDKEGKFANKISGFLMDYECSYNNCEYKKLRNKVSCTFEDMSKELKGAKKALCIAIHEMEELAKSDKMYDGAFVEYSECVEESSSDCDCESSSEDWDCGYKFISKPSKGWDCGCKSSSSSSEDWDCGCKSTCKSSEDWDCGCKSTCKSSKDWDCGCKSSSSSSEDWDCGCKSTCKSSKDWDCGCKSSSSSSEDWDCGCKTSSTSSKDWDCDCKSSSSSSDCDCDSSSSDDCNFKYKCGYWYKFK